MHRELMIYRIEKKHETRNSYWIANKVSIYIFFNYISFHVLKLNQKAIINR